MQSIDSEPKDGYLPKDARIRRARARVHGCHGEKEKPTVLRSLLDAVNQEDADLVVQVWREAMKAARSFWRETGKDEKGKSIGKWVTEPDHCTRLEAAKMVAAYKEGLPVARQVNLNLGGHEELREMLDKAKSSPAAQEMLRSMGFNQGVQETGTQKTIDVPSENG